MRKTELLFHVKVNISPNANDFVVHTSPTLRVLLTVSRTLMVNWICNGLKVLLNNSLMSLTKLDNNCKCEVSKMLVIQGHSDSITFWPS